MAFDPKALKRIDTVLLSGSRKVHFFNFATDDTLAEVTTAGYFNSVRDALAVHSIIHAVVDIDGTANYATIRLTAVPASGNVTAAIDTPAA